MKNQKNNLNSNQEDVIFLPGRNVYGGKSQNEEINLNIRHHNSNNSKNSQEISDIVNQINKDKQSKNNLIPKHSHSEVGLKHDQKNKPKDQGYEFDEYVHSDHQIIKNLSSIKNPSHINIKPNVVLDQEVNFINKINSNISNNSNNNNYIPNRKSVKKEENFVVTKENKRVDPFTRYTNPEDADYHDDVSLMLQII